MTSPDSPTTPPAQGTNCAYPNCQCEEVHQIVRSATEMARRINSVFTVDLGKLSSSPLCFLAHPPAQVSDPSDEFVCSLPTMRATRPPAQGVASYQDWDSETWQRATELVARTLASFRLGLDATNPYAFTEDEELRAGLIVGGLDANGLLLSRTRPSAETEGEEPTQKIAETISGNLWDYPTAGQERLAQHIAKQVYARLTLPSAEQAREEEREACARICETHIIYFEGMGPTRLVPSKSGEPAGHLFAAAIRQRKGS